MVKRPAGTGPCFFGSPNLSRPGSRLPAPDSEGSQVTFYVCRIESRSGKGADGFRSGWDRT
ncbi:hypothetical protein, partial [Bradyrhizobium jicamae]|uniref:hypothetical protein n=1 Tax=Bradyrhizobium jicamae TaxID=280332 RepID=UPI001FD9E2FE